MQGMSDLADYVSSSSAVRVLGNAGALRHILGYVGFGHLLYIGTVSQAWRTAYAACKHPSSVFQRKPKACQTLCTTYRAVFGSPSRLRLATDNGLVLDDGANRKLQRCAGKRADIATLTLAFKLGMPYTDEIMVGVALAGAINKLEWLHVDQKREFPVDLLECAAASGSLAMVSHAHKQYNFKINTRTAINAVKTRQLSILKYLHAEGYVFTTQALGRMGPIEVAAIVGDAEVMEWLDSIGCNWQEDSVYIAAAEQGRAQSLKWMYQHGAQYHNFIMTKAAMNNRLDACKYLSSIGCFGNEGTCDAAFYSKRLEVFKWLHEHGCPWDAKQLLFAPKNRDGYDGLRDYLLSQTPEWQTPAILTDLLNQAGALDNLSVAKWLRQQGAEWPQSLVYNGKKWRIAMAEWAREQGCTSPW
jgi:hypothetical protein